MLADEIRGAVDGARAGRGQQPRDLIDHDPVQAGEHLPMARLRRTTLAERLLALRRHDLAALDHRLVLALELRLRRLLVTGTQEEDDERHRQDAVSGHLTVQDTVWGATVSGRVAIRASSSARRSPRDPPVRDSSVVRPAPRGEDGPRPDAGRGRPGCAE